MDPTLKKVLNVLEPIIEKIMSIGRPDHLLVCEADFLGFTAAVLNKKGDVLTVAHHATSESLDISEAVKNVMNKLRKQGFKGKEAVLLTPSVLSAVVELSVPHKNKLTNTQMTEAVVWELEPLMAQHQRLLSIGQVLLSNGDIKPEQVDEIVAQQEVDGASKNREVMFKRFGEYARTSQYITDRELERGLARQKWFLGEVEELQAYWAPQKIVGDAVQDQTLFPWLVSAMSKPLAREWQAAFVQQGMTLLQCYPLAGATQVSLVGASDTQQAKQVNSQQKPQVLMDAQTGVLSAWVLQHERVVQTQSINVHEHDLLAKISDLYSSLSVADVDTLHLVNAVSKTEPDAQVLVDDLQQTLELPVKSITTNSEFVSAPMRGAAEHVLLNKAKNWATYAPVVEPLPPLMQRFGVRAMLGAVGVALLLLLTEVGMFANKTWVAWQQEKIAPDAKVIDDVEDRINTQISQVKKYKGAVKDKQLELETLTSNVALLSNDLPKRNQDVLDLLKSLEKTVTEDMVIDRVLEDTVLGFDIKGWSISEQSAQEFVRRLQIAVHPMGYRLKDVTVNQQTGRLGMLGYIVTLKVTALDDLAWEAQKLQRSGVTGSSTFGKTRI